MGLTIHQHLQANALSSTRAQSVIAATCYSLQVLLGISSSGSWASAPRLVGVEQRAALVEGEREGGVTGEEVTGGNEATALAGNEGDGEAAAGELALQLLRPRRHPFARGRFPLPERKRHRSQLGLAAL